MSFVSDSEQILAENDKRLGSREIPLSVFELTEKIKTKLETTFQEVVVVGEISNYKAHPSGHAYFSLKDSKATISAVMFRADGSRLRFKLQDGQKVIAIGKITVYPPRGNYQIIVSRMEPDGVGALQLAFEQLKKKLETEGLFAIERKRKLPLFPKCVGIVTSSSGAAIRDILQILDRRFSGLNVILYPVKVQGEGAAAEVAEAIAHFNLHFVEIDVLIVGRGGGSIEDLWAFNEEVVARAIFQSRIPIISAVGHEIDFTIADFVADLRAPTPSAAAELVIASKAEIIHRIDQWVRRLIQIRNRLEMVEMQIDDLLSKLQRILDSKIRDLRLHLETLKGKLWQLSPQTRIATSRHMLESFQMRLGNISKTILEKRTWHLEHLRAKLHLLNPRAIMDRGYSIVRILETKKVVKKAADVRMGDKLIIELSKGKITAKV
jgi:exodeoxyribonuclease VII large subunit